MSYRVRVESFEGPFDLLLYLVSHQKVAIGSISLSQIVDQFCLEVERMRSVDLDVASDFLLVASTLLEIKAASLLPREEAHEVETDREEMTPGQMRETLVEHLLTYKKFKNAAVALNARFEAEARIHVRPFGPDRSLLNLVPDYLENVELDELARRVCACFARRDVFLLESEHIAARVIPVETQVKTVFERLRDRREAQFSDLVPDEGDPHLVVVTFLALLELFKRNMIQVSQDELFGDIRLTYVEGAEAQMLDEGNYDSVG